MRELGATLDGAEHAASSGTSLIRSDFVEPPSPANGRRRRRGFLGAAFEWSAVAACLLLVATTRHVAYEDLVVVTTLAAAPLVAWIVVQDLASLTIADGAVAALAVLALGFRHAAGDPLLLLGADLLLSGGVLLAFREIYYRRRGFDGLGLGDVKLAAAGGLLVGAQTFAWSMLGASLLALGAVAIGFLVAQARGAVPAGAQKLAFGAFLAPALYAAWIVQQLPVLWPQGG